MAKKKHNIGTARWDLSTLCNLNCLHCCAENLYENNQYMEFEKAIDVIDRLWNNGISFLNILGKEPFLYPYLENILEYACKKGLKVDITTNGTVIKDNNINNLVAIGLHSIFFSLDGSSPQINDLIRGKGTYNKTIRNIKRIIKEKEKLNSVTQINVNTVLTKINALDIPRIIDLCAELRIDVFKLSRLNLIGNSIHFIDQLKLEPEEEFKIAEEAVKKITEHQELKFIILDSKPKLLEYYYKKYNVVFPVNVCGCKACIEEIYIDPNGEISPCLSTSENFIKNIDGNYKYYKNNIFELGEKPINEFIFYDDFEASYPLIWDTYRNYVPCNSCPYLTTICYPCPLGNLLDYHLEDLCLIADRKLTELN